MASKQREERTNNHSFNRKGLIKTPCPHHIKSEDAVKS